MGEYWIRCPGIRAERLEIMKFDMKNLADWILWMMGRGTLCDNMERLTREDKLLEKKMIASGELPVQVNRFGFRIRFPRNDEPA